MACAMARRGQRSKRAFDTRELKRDAFESGSATLTRSRDLGPSMPANGSSSESKPSIFPGATISGRFRLERLLGRGSMGSVWLARHLMLDVDVAVKFIDAAFRDQKDHRGRFAL